MCQETARSRFPFIPTSGSLNASLHLPLVAIILRRIVYDSRCASSFLCNEPRGDIAKGETKCKRGPLTSHTHIAFLPQSHSNANVSIMEEISEYDCCLHGNWLQSHNHKRYFTTRLLNDYIYL